MTQPDLLAGFTRFPADVAARYRQAGHWRGQTLWEVLRDASDERGEAIALVEGARRVTYAQLAARAQSLAAGFHRLGIAPRDAVVVQLPNSVALFEVLFALFRLGAIPVLALPLHRRFEIESFCQQTQATALVIADSLGSFDPRTLAPALRASVPSLRHVVVDGEAQQHVTLSRLGAPPQALQGLPENDPADVALFQLSGGSTGTPKLIPRTHDDYLCSVRAAVEICGSTHETVYLVALPAGHNFPLSSPGSLGTLLAHGRVVLAKTGAPDEVFALIEQERVTMSAVVPPLLLVWLEALRHRKVDLSSLRLLQVGGAKLAEHVAQRVRPAFGCTLQQVFGMAEGLVCYTRLSDSEPLICQTQGRPASDADEVRVVDENDQPLADGMTGHLLTRGPYTVRGYYRAEEYNQRAFTPDGFYRTGDIVTRLPSGHLIVQGRAKDQINRGGEKIAAPEVEAVLGTHPNVRDAALVAIPDPLLGERACAFIASCGLQPSARELNRYLRERGLAAYKIPDRYEFIERLPQTNVGKVDKKQLTMLLANAQRSTESAHKAAASAVHEGGEA